jgi:hypothetical protein
MNAAQPKRRLQPTRIAATIGVMGKWRYGAAIALTTLLSCQVFVGFDYPDAGPDAAPPSDAAIDHGEAGRVFATSFEVHGDLGGVDGGDWICASAAADAGLASPGRVWKVYLADESTTAVDHLGAGHFAWYRLVDGQDVGDLVQFSTDKAALDNPIAVNERGNDAAVPSFVWTGKGSNTCASWTTRDAGVNGWCGNTGFADVRWTSAVENPRQCSLTAGLYCVELQK